MHATLGIGGGAAWRSRRCWMSEEACCGDEAAAPQRDRRVVRRSCIVVGDDGLRCQYVFADALF
jgi:hypothetical protein